MQHHHNRGARHAAYQDEVDYLQIGDRETNQLAEIDHVIAQFDWEFLNGETRQDVDMQPCTHQYFENRDTFLEADVDLQLSTQSTLQSPQTMTDSLLDTQIIPYYEPSADIAYMCSNSALSMMPDLSPDLLGFTFDTSFAWDTALTQLEMDAALDRNSSDISSTMRDDCFPQSEHFIQPNASSPPPHPSRSALHAVPASQQAYICTTCSATFPSIIKLKTHTNKHTKPFRCTAPLCAYASAEKKSLQRHVLARKKWDEGHRVAAEDLSVKEVKYRCARDGCEYVTIREDNLRRHVGKCLA
ncbi:unnamed protein product [Discula destructiva]